MTKTFFYKDTPLINCTFNNQGNILSAEIIGDENLLPVLVQKLLSDSNDVVFGMSRWIDLRESGLKRPDTADFIVKTEKLSKSKLNYGSDFDYYHFDGVQDNNIKTSPTREEITVRRQDDGLKIQTRRIERTKILKNIASQNKLEIFNYEPSIDEDILYYELFVKNAKELISFMEYFAYESVTAKAIIECCKKNKIPNYANFFYDLCICDEIVDIEKTLNNVFVAVDESKNPLCLVIL